MCIFQTPVRSIWATEELLIFHRTSLAEATESEFTSSPWCDILLRWIGTTQRWQQERTIYHKVCAPHLYKS